MEELTIGALKTRNLGNGSPLTDINSKDDLKKVRAVAIGKKKEYYEVNKEKIKQQMKEYNKQYYEENKEKRKEKRR